jgi:transposase
MVQASFIPPAPIRALRELTRYRKSLVQERATAANRLHKVLESANIKLAAVASDVLGVSGRDMLSALITGEADPDVLAALARGRLREKLPALRQALQGRVKPHHQVLITQILAHIDFLDASIAQLAVEIAHSLVPLSAAVTLLQTIPGISETTAAIIVAEIGTDMSRFASAKHLASWAGLCPGNRQSGGRRLNGKPTNGDRWLRAVLGEVAWVIARMPGTYLHAQYQRIARRRGRNRAAVAVAHSVLIIIYHVLREQKPFTDLGADYFEQLDAERLQRHHVRRLEQLGYKVDLTPLHIA